MHNSQTRLEGNHVLFPTPVCDVVGRNLDADERHRQNETVWTGLQDNEFEAVS